MDAVEVVKRRRRGEEERRRKRKKKGEMGEKRRGKLELPGMIDVTMTLTGPLGPCRAHGVAQFA